MENMDARSRIPRSFLRAPSLRPERAQAHRSRLCTTFYALVFATDYFAREPVSGLYVCEIRHEVVIRMFKLRRRQLVAELPNGRTRTPRCDLHVKPFSKWRDQREGEIDWLHDDLRG